MDYKNTGAEMYQWAVDLFPVCRSITGEGVRETLRYLQKILPKMDIKEIKSGEKVFDWTIPDEWNIKGAYVEDEAGNRVIDMAWNNLHVVGYSEPVDRFMSLKELDQHLHSLPCQPDAIPYVTSYYQRSWGFCLTDNQRKQLKHQTFRVVIDSEICPGNLNYGEILIPGELKEEIFLSTYICHPSMGNNELSGPVLAAAIGKFLMQGSLKKKYTYRIIFVPETIGSIAYIHKNLTDLKNNVRAGFNITCVGDDRCYSFLPSRAGDTLSDRVATHVLNWLSNDFKVYEWLHRGSDERQYCAPGVDLPVASIMRSKYGEYPEYHTSLDNLDLISAKGLSGSLEAYLKCIEILENNPILIAKNLCEPQLGRRGLYPNLSKKNAAVNSRNILNILTYADGKLDLLGICEKLRVSYFELKPLIDLLLDEGLLIESEKV